MSLLLNLGVTKKSEKFELVHTNVYIPTSIELTGVFRYYVTFIDDTRKIRVYFLENNLDVFTSFKKRSRHGKFQVTTRQVSGHVVMTYGHAMKFAEEGHPTNKDLVRFFLRFLRMNNLVVTNLDILGV